MTSPAIGPVAASFSKPICGMPSSWVFSTAVKFKLAVNLNGLACKRERETVIYVSLLGDATLNMKS